MPARRLSAVLLALAVLAGCGSAARTGTAAPTRRAPAPAPAASATAGVSRLPWRLPEPLSREVVLLTRRGVVVAGGLTAGGTSTASVHLLSLADGRAAPSGALAVPVHDAAGAVLGGRCYVLGGGSTASFDTVQGFAPPASATVAGHLPQPRSDLAAATVDGTAYVLGGYTGAAELAEVYATRDGRTFRPAGALALTVRYPAVAVVGRDVLVLGGEHDGRATDAVQRFDTVTGRAAVVAHLPAPLAHATAGTVAGTVLVAGGRTGGRVTPQVWRFDPRTLRATPAGVLPTPVADAGGVVADGALWLLGGEDTGRVDVVQRVTPGG